MHSVVIVIEGEGGGHYGLRFPSRVGSKPLALLLPAVEASAKPGKRQHQQHKQTVVDS